MGFASAVSKAGLANADKQEVKHYLSTGYPILNQRLTGRYRSNTGLPSGRMVEIIGPSSSGKTAIANEAMVSAQKAGGLAGFNDHERSFDISLARSNGLSDDPDNWVYDTPTTFEQSIDRMREKVLIARQMEFKGGEYRPIKGATPFFTMEKPIVWVFDSLAAMVPQSALITDKGEDKDATDRNMNDNTALARATAAHFPALAIFAEATNTTIIFLNQVRTKIGGASKVPQFTSPGGNAPEFYMTVRIRLSRSMIYDQKTGSYTGQDIKAEVIKNKTYRPFTKCEWQFNFMADGTGKFDVMSGVIDELKDLGRLTMSGAYIEWIDGKKRYKSEILDIIERDGLHQQIIDMLPD